MRKSTHKGNLNAVETVRGVRMTGDVYIGGEIAITVQNRVKNLGGG